MNADERAVATALRRVATDARPAQVPGDLWRRGRRRRRLRVAAAATGVVVALGLATVPMVQLVRSPEVAPAQEPPSIPSRVEMPLPFQPTVDDAPNGPASVILTGPGGFGDYSIFYDDRAIVVGRHGHYRWLYDVNDVHAGMDLLLSPDGRFVAGGATLAAGVSSSADWAPATVVDLTTGRVHRHRHGQPVAWSPDGRLLVRPPTGSLMLMEPETGATTDTGAPGADAVAFSPDGRVLVTQHGKQLNAFDLAAHTERTVAVLDDGWLLAGPGAVGPDGTIAVWQRSECGSGCGDGYADFTLSFVDGVDGAVVAGPTLATVRTRQPSLLGWQSDGDAIVVLTAPSGPAPGGDSVAWYFDHEPPQVVALHLGGGETSLISLPSGASRIDIARNLLDRFGAAPPSLADHAVDWFAVRGRQATVLLAVVALLIAARIGYRRLRSRWRTGRSRGTSAAGREPT